MDMTLTDLALQYGPIAAIAIYAGSLALQKFFAGREGMAESGARVDVIDMLSARVKALEESQQAAQRAFDEERVRRMKAEDDVALLKYRVSSLETQLRDLGHEPR
ncbi:MAG TPA: hypothetical protein PLR28_11215 [Dokdonella sp.]|nr:hypothetical protein [Dokdonella sp.]